MRKQSAQCELVTPRAPWFKTITLVIGLAMASECWAADLRAIEYDRDVRPILSDKCFHCHGPDAAQRQADLRLDTEEGAKIAIGDHRPIVPGDPDNSEIVRRITSEDDDEHMPPPPSGLKLTSGQIATLCAWIEQGAKWQKHWAFVPVQRPALPVIRNAAWPKNPIDHFIVERMEQSALAPSPQADRATLIRRVSLDLTGLPPTPSDVDTFVSDQSVDAFEKVVDHLLASSHYGERMAVPWLDAARYADTNGYQTDGERTMWRWRDWVIDAFNGNMPFDQFTIEQLAGDLLPHATLAQRTATGFNRNHRGNGEGGIIPEEYAAEYVADRVETTATVWLGLTLGCARCHDHKYDPLTQKEFYQFFAIFNQVPERGKAVKNGNSPPFIKAPTAEQKLELTNLDAQIATIEQRLASPELDVAGALVNWETERPELQEPFWSIRRHLVARLPNDAAMPEPMARSIDGELVLTVGPVEAAYQLAGASHIDCGDIGDYGYLNKLTLAAWVMCDCKQDGVICSRVAESEDNKGYNLQIVDGKVQFNLVARWLDDSIRVETEKSLPGSQWTHVAATYDGSRTAPGAMVYVNGRPQKLRYLVDDLNQDFQIAEHFRIGAGGPAGRFRGEITDVRVHATCLAPDEIEVLATDASIPTILSIPAGQRTPRQSQKLRAYFVQRTAPAHIRDANETLVALREQREQLIDSFPTTMVMDEMAVPRETYLLKRGRYDQPSEKVAAGVPLCLGEEEFAPRNRLGLARWLLSPANPLTARVIVNRNWQMYFGTGLVKTVDDFGTQGEPPSHPALLDWLAAQFISSGWDVKALQKLIVTSATYQQSSVPTADRQRVDPENRLLSHAPRPRLSAEFIRDQALAASGLLVRRVGGRSVKPYQPAGLWSELTGGGDYEQGYGEDLYRRSIYTYVKRTVAPPAMAAFDASSRETCIVRITRTNTPLQALTLMNDITFVETARALAERAMHEASPAASIERAFRFVLARQPTARELGKLCASAERYLADFDLHPEDAAALVKIGETAPGADLDVRKLAAYTLVASIILNLDETVTKE